jgi:hypothetical protein
MPRKQSARSASMPSKQGVRVLERSLTFLQKVQENLEGMQGSLKELHNIVSDDSRNTVAAKATQRPSSSKTSKQTTRRSKTATRGKNQSHRAGNVTRAARSGRQGTERLSSSTKYAKWINSPNDHEDRPGQSLVTRNHDVIQSWAEERGAQPATVATTEQGHAPRVLRFDFPGYGGKKLKSISWDEWFEPFDERNLAFHFQEHKTDGSLSNFFRLDSPDREDA